MLDDFDLDIPEEDNLDDFLADDDDDGGDSEGGGDNRRFIIIAASIGGFIILALLCLWIFNSFSSNATESAAEETLAASNIIKTQTEEALLAKASGTAVNTATATIDATEEPTETNTPEPSSTSPSIASPTDTPIGGPTSDPRTATVQALLTQAALAQTQAAVQILTFTPTSTPAALPDAGFLDFDNFSTQDLFILTGILLLVIVLAQKLRASNAEN